MLVNVGGRKLIEFTSQYSARRKREIRGKLIQI